MLYFLMLEWQLSQSYDSTSSSKITNRKLSKHISTEYDCYSYSIFQKTWSVGFYIPCNHWKILSGDFKTLSFFKKWDCKSLNKKGSSFSKKENVIWLWKFYPLQMYGNKCLLHSFSSLTPSCRVVLHIRVQHFENMKRKHIHDHMTTSFLKKWKCYFLVEQWRSYFWKKELFDHRNVFQQHN